MHMFDQDISLERIDDLHFRAAVSDNWSANGNPDGGYLMALLANGMMQVSEKSFSPIFTANYVSRSVPGKADIFIEGLSDSTQFARYQARLVQDGQEKVRMFGTFAREDEACLEEWYEESPPDIAPLDECVPIPAFSNKYTLFANMDVRLDPRCAGWIQGETSDISRLKGWITFRHPRDHDMFSLTLAADSFPPAVLASQGMVAWVPTLEFTVNIRNMPLKPWLKCLFRTRFVTCGLLEEDGEMWDERGELVAICRQIAQYRKVKAG